ncbi:MAG TPA: PHB depolymerase family esterase [Pseudonocardia sp.]|nr:PHB depolymerase family esterase [Pseudonocardia sp.]
MVQLALLSLIVLLLIVAVPRLVGSAAGAGGDRSADASGPAAATTADESSGTLASVHTLAFGGLDRTYRAYIPAGPPGRWPLLVVLHGRGQSAQAVVNQSGFVGLARRGQAVVIFPDGVGRSWNAGSGCCGVAANRRLPDAGFIRAVVADSTRALPVDAGRVYLVGYSNGGKLGYGMACGEPALFAAIATYGAVPLTACPAGAAPVSMLLAAGVRDSILPFGGAPKAHPPLPSDRGALGWLLAQDRCPPTPVTSTAGRATVVRWVGCAGGSEVESVVYPGVGHSWPSAAVSGSPELANLMWAFLSSHRTGPPLARLAATPSGPNAAPAAPATAAPATAPPAAPATAAPPAPAPVRADG